MNGDVGSIRSFLSLPDYQNKIPQKVPGYGTQYGGDWYGHNDTKEYQIPFPGILDPLVCIRWDVDHLVLTDMFSLVIDVHDPFAGKDIIHL